MPFPANFFFLTELSEVVTIKATTHNGVKGLLSCVAITALPCFIHDDHIIDNEVINVAATSAMYVRVSGLKALTPNSLGIFG